MGRSVSYPAGAQVAFRILDSDEPDDADWEYETLCDDILAQACAAFPSFDRCKGWRGREDRILRNSYCDIGISTYGCIAAIWIAERDDPTYHDADARTGRSGRARQWLAQVTPKFDALFAQLDCIGAGCRTARRFIGDARQRDGTVQMNIRMLYRSCERIARWLLYWLNRVMTRIS